MEEPEIRALIGEMTPEELLDFNSPDGFEQRCRKAEFEAQHIYGKPLRGLHCIEDVDSGEGGDDDENAR